MHLSILSNPFLDLYSKHIEKYKDKKHFVIPKIITNTRRSMPEKYFIFASNFIAPVVGKKRFDNYKWQFEFNKYVSVSDETFALLIFENNFDRWMSMAVANNQTSSEVAPEYTSGGNVAQTPKTTQSKSSITKKKNTGKNDRVLDEQICPTTSKFQGWSIEGIKQFNELYDLVEKECESENGVSFEESFLLTCIEEKESVSKKRLKGKILNMRCVGMICGEMK